MKIKVAIEMEVNFNKDFNNDEIGELVEDFSKTAVDELQELVRDHIKLEYKGNSYLTPDDFTYGEDSIGWNRGILDWN